MTKILVVDDEPDIRQLVRMILELNGYEVKEACSGREALEEARAWRPELILLDLMMPEMDGYEVVSRLRQFSNVPVIIFTVRSQPLDKVLGLEYADDYVTKPFDRSELLARIRAVLRRTTVTRGQNVESAILNKHAAGDYDVFLCYNSLDRPDIIDVATRLKSRGILPWLDEWELRPGLPWQRALEDQLPGIAAAAVFVGKEGVGPWQHMEIEAFLREFVKRKCPIIPVLLPSATAEPAMPLFLKGMTWVDFRRLDYDPLDRLIWGITGDNPFST